jgi:chemotaxis family two-component system response regulator Rcp1
MADRGEREMSDAVIEILLVEDNLGDVLLTREALGEAQVRHRISVVHDGVEATDFLFRRGRHAQAPRPDLILLDLNLPCKNGREVIAEIEAEPSLHATPLVVLTTSPHDQEVLDGYDPAKCVYMVKPSSFDELVETARQIEQFWKTVTSRG